GIIGMIPLTPGGLGLVEASLTGLLVLAEVNSSQAVLATLTYRIASYWLPLGVDAGHRIVRPGQFHRPLDTGPLPAGPDDHAGPRPGPQVRHTVRVTAADQTDDLSPGHRMRQHARVNHRRLDRAVRPRRG